MKTGQRTLAKDGTEIVWIDRNDAPGAPMITKKEMEGNCVNGKYYPMWQQFINRKDEWIGGVMEDIEYGPSEALKTEITDVTLTPNGTDSAMFSFHGKDFDCGFDVQHGGIVTGEKDWLTLHRQYLGDFRVKRKSDE